MAHDFNARTLCGRFSPFCKVCWEPVYTLWVDDADPAGKCMHGHAAAHECPDAMSRAQFAAAMAKHRAAGLLPWQVASEPKP